MKKRQRSETLKDNPIRICTYEGCGKEHKTTRGWCPDCRAGVSLTKKESDVLPYHVVYAHVSPDGEMMYIGEGTVTRPYLYRNSSANRDPKHSKWLHEQFTNRPPQEVVRILETNLTKAEARDAETILVQKFTPHFNKSNKG